MRTPTWETSPGALTALLNSRAPLRKADLWTVTLASGAVLQWSGGDTALQAGPRLFSIGPAIERTRVRFTVGIEVDVMTVTMMSATTTINGKSLAAFIRSRGMDGAKVQLERAFWGAGDSGPVGTLLWFLGMVDDADGDGHAAKLKVSSMVKWLNTQVPRDVYQGPCANVLYDPATCKVNRAARVVSGTAQSVTNSLRVKFDHDLPQAVGYFALGVITMTSGANTGISRTVKTFGPSSITVLRPWPFPVDAGDSYDMVPGCDGTFATCGAKFSNTINFRGQPLIPAAETVL